jgi:hypothetical protein
MRRLLVACVASLLLYAATFGLVLDRPLSLGFLADQIDLRLDRGATLAGPKLVILAGSNGPYSHRCEIIEPILRRPCVNAGVAVGIGLDYLFARWRPLLHPGDVVYLPLEEAQYTRSSAAAAVGPDAAIMWRHDRGTLAQLGADRWLGALFAFDLRAALDSLAEMGLVAAGFHDPRAATVGASNAWGDHIGHTPALGAVDAPILAASRPWHASPDQIEGGDGTVVVRTFLAWAQAHGVRVIGGLPTEFADAPIPPATIAAIGRVYRDAGAGFLLLPNHSTYPRLAFFDTPEHLNEPAQIAHSRILAAALAPLLACDASAQAAPCGPRRLSWAAGRGTERP